MNQLGNSKAKEISLEMVIIRADGTREDLGQVLYWNKNPLKTLYWRVKRWLRSLLILVKQ